MNLKQPKISRVVRVLAMSMLFSSALTGALHAQNKQATPSSSSQPVTKPAEEDVVELEELVTIGSRFEERSIIASPVPIDVVTSAEMKQGGYTETAQMLQVLVPSFNFPRPTVADGTDHIRPATLRGLAPDQTLVLINGKRRHTSALVNVNNSVGRGSVSVDFNAIPSSSIQRIEVLRDGASAQYGSDAIAGVINVVLEGKPTFGGGADFLFGTTEEGDGEVRDYSVWGSMPLGSEGGSLFATVFSRDRNGTNRTLPDTRQQYFGTNTTTGALTAISGNFGSGTTNPPAGVTLDPREATFNRLNHWQGDPDTHDLGLSFDAKLPLRSGMQAYAFGDYSVRDGKAAGFFRRPGDDRTVRAIYPDGFLPKINSDIKDLSLGGGIKGHATDWKWDLSSVIGGNQFEFFITDTANVTLGAQSPDHFHAGKLKFTQWTTNFDASNELHIAPLTSPLKVAAGLEYRWEKYLIGAGEPDSYRDGSVRILDGPNGPRPGTPLGNLAGPGAQVFPGFRPTDAIDTDRESYALYVDAENHLTNNLLVSLAGRFENYADFGSQVTGKLAARYQVTTPFALRGSVSTGFRAPHLAQEWFSSTATNFIGGLPFDNKTFPVTDPVARVLGAKDLEPETSLSTSIGATWASGPFTATLDLYRIKIDDRIVLSSTFIDGAGVTLIKDFLAANGQPQAVGGRYFTNAVDTRTHGVDLNLRYQLNTSDRGRFTFGAGFNHNETKVTRFAPTPSQLQSLTTIPLFDITERTRMERGQPRNVISLSTTWDLKPFTITARTIRYGKVSAIATDNAGWTQARIDALTPGFDVSFAPAVPTIQQNGTIVPTANQQVIQTFDAKWITDLDVSYKFSEQWRLSIGVNNIADVYPEKNIGSTPAFLGSDNAGIFPYNSHSPFGFNGRFYFGRMSCAF